MNFRPELARAVLEGRKTVTRRLTSANPRSPWYEDRCGYTAGKPFAVCPGRGEHSIGRAVVTDVRREQLGVLSDDEARAEGFAEAHDFEEAFAAINGGYDASVTVWRIEFRLERPAVS